MGLSILDFGFDFGKCCKSYAAFSLPLSCPRGKLYCLISSRRCCRRNRPNLRTPEETGVSRSLLPIPSVSTLSRLFSFSNLSPTKKENLTGTLQCRADARIIRNLNVSLPNLRTCGIADRATWLIWFLSGRSERRSRSGTLATEGGSYRCAADDINSSQKFWSIREGR